jgi:hypothetical protein
VESDLKPSNISEDAECPEQWDVSVAPNIPGLICPTCMSQTQADKVLGMVNAIETRRNKGVKKK